LMLSIITDYLSKAKEKNIGANLIKAFDKNKYQQKVRKI